MTSKRSRSDTSYQMIPEGLKKTKALSKVPLPREAPDLSTVKGLNDKKVSTLSIYGFLDIISSKIVQKSY